MTLRAYRIGFIGTTYNCLCIISFSLCSISYMYKTPWVKKKNIDEDANIRAMLIPLVLYILIERIVCYAKHNIFALLQVEVGLDMRFFTYSYISYKYIWYFYLLAIHDDAQKKQKIHRLARRFMYIGYTERMICDHQSWIFCHICAMRLRDAFPMRYARYI